MGSNRGGGDNGLGVNVGAVILEELRDMKRHGCLRGAENRVEVQHLKDTQAEHGQRLQRTEADVLEIGNTVKAMPEQVSTQVINKMDRNIGRTLIPINAFGVQFKLPASWIGWGLALGGIAYGIYAHMQGIEKTRADLKQLKQHIKIEAPADPAEVACNDTTGNSRL